MNSRSRSPNPVGSSVDQTLRASDTGTEGFCREFEAQFVEGFFRPTAFGLTASSVGIGTYLGEATSGDDAAYVAAVRGAALVVPNTWQALANGITEHVTQSAEGRVYRFRETDPLPTYLFAFAAG